MAYNTTNITDANNIYELYKAVNILSASLLSGVMLYAIFFILMFVFKERYDIKSLLLGDSFICSILGVILWWLGFIGWPVLVPLMIVFFIMIMVNLFNG